MARFYPKTKIPGYDPEEATLPSSVDNELHAVGRSMTRPVESDSGPRESIFAGPYRNLIPIETSRQLLTGKTHKRELG